jgi:trigger factor
MVDEKADEMVDSFERSIRAQGLEPEQYYQLAGTGREDVKGRVRDDAADTVKKELVLDAVANAEGITADEHDVMHQIEHLADDSDRSPQQIATFMRSNGTYQLLKEEMARAKALDFLAENAVPVPMPEEEKPEGEADDANGGREDDVPGTEEAEPVAGEARVEASVQAGEGSAETENEKNEGKE